MRACPGSGAQSGKVRSVLARFLVSSARSMIPRSAWSSNRFVGVAISRDLEPRRGEHGLVTTRSRSTDAHGGRRPLRRNPKPKTRARSATPELNVGVRAVSERLEQFRETPGVGGNAEDTRVDDHATATGVPHLDERRAERRPPDEARDLAEIPAAERSDCSRRTWGRWARHLTQSVDEDLGEL